MVRLSQNRGYSDLTWLICSKQLATFGARLVESVLKSPPRSTACIVLKGKGFPKSLLRTLQGWQLNLLIRDMPNEDVSKSLVTYVDREHWIDSKSCSGPLLDPVWTSEADALIENQFKYTTMPLQPEPTHLQSNKLLRSRAFHFLASPQDLERQVSTLLALRRDRNRISAFYCVGTSTCGLHKGESGGSSAMLQIGRCFLTQSIGIEQPLPRRR